MAINYTGTNLKFSAMREAEAIGATIPAAAEFQDHQYKQDIEVAVAKSSVENASDVTTFDALVVSVDGSLSAIVTNDYIATNTVDAYGELREIKLITDPKYTDSVTNYVCTCSIYTKVS